MKYVLTILVVLSACAPAAKDNAESKDQSGSEYGDEKSEFAASIFSEVPELAECREMLHSQEGIIVSEPSRTKSNYANMVEVPCGAAPGTGAYGYPMSLVVEWEAMENTPEGPMPGRYAPIVFHEKDESGSFVPVGYVTQAIGYWDESDLSQGYLHLLYKYAGAGQCGMLVTYTSEAWQSPFEFREVRERTCDAEPCEDGSCFEPKNWELVYSAWD